MGKPANLIGQRFERLLVKEKKGKNKHNKVVWICICDCGNKVETTTGSLHTGNTQSCGCLGKEKRNQNNLRNKLSNPKIGHVRSGMIQRCYNPKNKRYKNYGGRGIAVCKEWLESPRAFHDWAVASGYKEGLSIERINNNGDYEPSNCRWIPMREQVNNQTLTRYIPYNGEVKTLTQWAKQYRLNISTLKDRLDKLGWTMEKSLTVAAKEQKRKEITYQGKTKNLSQWDKYNGFGDGTTGHRLKNGWSEEEAVSPLKYIPIRNRRK